jgi:UDP-GlcNAc:undecaprenyl-phosphate/decaprenyl-phosphate GlcNAc-1-phosphate transferase
MLPYLHNYMLDYVLLALLAFGISVILTPIVRRKSRQTGQALDLPGTPRKIHAAPTPRLGGIAIYGAFFLSLLPILLTNDDTHVLFRHHFDILLCLWGTSTLIFLIGLYDDFRGATVAQKFAVQVLASLLAYSGGFAVQAISIPFVGSVPLGVFGCL